VDLTLSMSDRVTSSLEASTVFAAMGLARHVLRASR
jgi:hypothetical protein